MSQIDFISHLYCDDEWHLQSNSQHSTGVAELAAHFASEFGLYDWGRFLGLLHDRGKETTAFQAYIKRNSGYDPTARYEGNKDHSYIGANIAHKHPFDKKLYWLSNPIAGHHGGLYNVDELETLLNREVPKGVSQCLPDINLPLPKWNLEYSDSSHIVRMLFSCLVDADWLDTERFMNPAQSNMRRNFSTLPELHDRLMQYLEKFSKLPQSDVNKIRNDVQKKCKETAEIAPGFFQLTVPTGGGKTIASIIWALNHAIAHNKKRIIIAIPYTSIIVQTAAILRKIFGNHNIVEHHSVLNEADADESTLLACENWDAPIIITTNVQLFESIFSNRRSACRKLHSLSNSVVILDEVQTLPSPFLQPIVSAMKTYRKLFGTSFLFCTASQPILDGDHKGSNNALFKGIDPTEIHSIIPLSDNLHDKLRRVEIKFDTDSSDYDSLAERLMEHNRVLCIVNTRIHALQLFHHLSQKDDVPTFHLSRSMCADHILQTINEIKEILADPDKSIRVVSTQLIEAGVDIDFPVVFRQLAGLDSILQAAGRCNREGKEIDKGLTTVFDFKNDKKYGAIRNGADTMKDLISLFPDSDWLSPVTMQLFYEKLYRRTPDFDKEGIENMLKHPDYCQFEEAAKKFSLINEVGKNIIVNFGEANRLIEELRLKGPSRSLTRRLGRFSVNIPTRLFNELERAGLIEQPYPGFFFIPTSSQYDSSTGLRSDNQFIEELFII